MYTWSEYISIHNTFYFTALWKPLPEKKAVWLEWLLLWTSSFSSIKWKCFLNLLNTECNSQILLSFCKLENHYWGSQNWELVKMRDHQVTSVQWQKTLHIDHLKINPHNPEPMRCDTGSKTPQAADCLKDNWGVIVLFWRQDQLRR